MARARFATAINCMDGRTQLPVNAWLCREYGVDFVDTITEPGPNRILAARTDPVAVESIRRRVAISIDKHGSRVVAVVGHYDCAGNPVGFETQQQHTRQAVAAVRSWNLGVEVIGLWIGEDWQVRPAD